MRSFFAYARLIMIPVAVWAAFGYVELGYDYVVEGHGLHPALCALALIVLALGMIGAFMIPLDE